MKKLGKTRKKLGKNQKVVTKPEQWYRKGNKKITDIALIKIYMFLIQKFKCSHRK